MAIHYCSWYFSHVVSTSFPQIAEELRLASSQAVQSIRETHRALQALESRAIPSDDGR